MAAFRQPYHPSLSSISIGDMDRDRQTGASHFSPSLPYHQQFPHLQSQPEPQSPRSPFRGMADPSPSPYSSQHTLGMKQSMSDFSHAHDPESAAIDPVNRAHDADLDSAGVNNMGGPASLLTRARRLIPHSIFCRLYLLTVLVESTVDVVIEGVIYSKMRDYYEGLSNSSQGTKADDDLSIKRLPVYLGIFAFAQYVVVSHSWLASLTTHLACTNSLWRCSPYTNGTQCSSFFLAVSALPLVIYLV